MASESVNSADVCGLRSAYFCLEKNLLGLFDEPPVLSRLDSVRGTRHSHLDSPNLCGRPLLDDPMHWLLQFFTWWNGQSLNTRFHTWRNGESVGQDEQGNQYYRTKGGQIDSALGFERRWVIFAGESDASKVPPGWHGWLHHTFDTPPNQESYQAREWELPHLANQTGTPAAYRPQGSTLSTAKRPPASGDYQAWTPGR